jgi:ATP-dependent helicase/nuclease subunit A
VRRIDRLVEFSDELWVLDYKTGRPPKDPDLKLQYAAQIREYCDAMQAAFPGKPVKGLLVFADGTTLSG